jgi:exodeoxyribonuclease III
MKIICWNIAGVRARLKKGDLDFIQDGEYDVVCLQETKAKPEQVTMPEHISKTYPHQFWHANSGTTQRAGFSGTCIWTKEAPIKQHEPPAFDTEGRTTTLEFEKFNLVNVYTPNSQDAKSDRCKYRIETWDPEFRKYIEELNRVKPTIICGDFNVAYEDIDLYAAKKYYNACAGFLNVEREEFGNHLVAGFVDAFRIKNKEPEKYTYWNQRVPAMRKSNRGWRIDYFLVPHALTQHIKSCEIHPEILGSDHCPITLEI